MIFNTVSICTLVVPICYTDVDAGLAKHIITENQTLKFHDAEILMALCNLTKKRMCSLTSIFTTLIIKTLYIPIYYFLEFINLQ